MFRRHTSHESDQFQKRACLHKGGGPQAGEVIGIGEVTRLSIWSLILIWSRLLYFYVYVTVGEIIWTCGLPHLSWVPHLPAILITLNWDNPCCTHISDKKKLCSSPPPPCWFFLRLTWKLAKTNIEGEENTPIVLTNVTKWRVLQFRHVKLGHPVLNPYSDKKLCSSPPPALLFLLLTRNYNNNNKSFIFMTIKVL